MDNIKNVFAYRDMVVSLVKRDLRGRYKGSTLGFLWTLINPLFQLIIYTIVFSIVLRSNIEDYYLFLFVALVPWSFFSASVHAGAFCVWSQKGMINKIYFPGAVLPISHVLSQVVNLLLSFIVVFLALIVGGKELNFVALVTLPIIIVIEFIFALGITFVVSAVAVFFTDLMQILGILVMLWQFMTPVMYPIDDVPEHMLIYFQINPMTSIITAYRDVLYYAKLPELGSLARAGGLSILLLLIGWVVFCELEKHFSEVL